MKRILLIIAILLCASTGWAASYYGCAGAAINADSTFCATPSGSCAGSDAVTAATALAGTHTLYANGCTITIPSGTFTAAKLSTKDGDAGGSAVAGGGFTANANDITVTLDASIEGGTTDCLTISNTAGTATTFNLLTTSGGGTITADATASADGVYISGSKVTLTIGKSGSPVTITGGGAACYGVNDVHSVTTSTVYANITGGSNSSGVGYWTGTGTVNITGDITGSTAYGMRSDVSGAVNVTGNCTGGTTGHGCGNTGSEGVMTITGNCTGGTANSAGCLCNSTSTGRTVVQGNIVGSATYSGVQGKIRWEPADQTKYVSFDGGGTPIYASWVPATNATAYVAGEDIPSTKSFLNSADGTVDAGTGETSSGGMGASAW